MAPVKRKLTNKPLAENSKALKKWVVEDVATKYGVPRNTVSTWVKSKHKLTASLGKKGMNSSRKNTRCGNDEKVDRAICNWFVKKRSQKYLHMVSYKRESLGIRKSIGCYRIQSIRLLVE